MKNMILDEVSSVLYLNGDNHSASQVEMIELTNVAMYESRIITIFRTYDSHIQNIRKLWFAVIDEELLKKGEKNRVETGTPSIGDNRSSKISQTFK